MRAIALIPLAGVAFFLIVVLCIAIAQSGEAGALAVVAAGVAVYVGVHRWSKQETQKAERADVLAPPVPSERKPWSVSDIPANLLRLIREAPKKYGLPALLGVVKGAKARTWIDVAKAPHILIGGATGSGKSVCLNTIIATATATMRPEDLNLVVIDPKRVELGRFASLPHCRAHVTEKPVALTVLEALADEMDSRYGLLQQTGARDINGSGLPRYLVVIDEFADLVIPHTRTREQKSLCESINAVLARLLALGRAAGIHVILATQSPRREVVTGLIKGNAPMRIAFRTSNKVESRIILDANGAEALPGRGAGLILSPQIPNPVKPGTPVGFQGVMLSESLIDRYCGG